MLALFIAVFLLVKSQAGWPWWVAFSIVVFCTAIMAIAK